MPMKLVFAIFSFAVSLLFLSCGEEKGRASLCETEYFFGERLSSLSPAGDSALWIGGEAGELWHWTPRAKKHFDLGSERIYDVETHAASPTGDTLWVGVRNGGVQQWIVSGTAARKLADLPIVGKGTNYSAYDLLQQGNRLWVGSSQGLYLCPDIRSQRLRLLHIYPHSGSQGGAPPPFVVKKLVITPSGTLVCVTQNGLLHVNTHTLATHLTHVGEKTDYLSLDNGRLLILAGNRFYVETIDGERSEYHTLPFHATSFYSTGSGYCFFNGSRAMLSHDLENFVEVPLRRAVPATSTNLSHPDPSAGTVTLLTDNAVWTVPLHLSPSSSGIAFVTAGASEQGAYYINEQGDVYFQPTGSRLSEQVYSFPEPVLLSHCQVWGNTLFYIRDGHSVEELTLRQNIFYNYLFARPVQLYDTQAKITAFGMVRQADSLRLFVGIQDGAVCIAPEQRVVRPLHLFDNKYITRCYVPQKGETMCMPTLNNGVYYGNGTTFRPLPGSAGVKNIADMATFGDYPAITVLLANNKLFTLTHRDTLPAKGVNRMVNLNDSLLYTFPEYGISRYSVTNKGLSAPRLFFQNIRFNPAVTFANHGYLHAGSNLGVYCFKPGEEQQGYWLTPVPTPFTRTRLLVGLLIVVTVIGFLAGFVWKFRQMRAQQRHEAVALLRRRLDELQAVGRLLNRPDNNEQQQLYERLEAIAALPPSRHRQARRELTALSDAVTTRNANTALQLMRLLDEQMAQMTALDLFEGRLLVNRSLQTMNGCNIDNVVTQALENDRWLRTTGERQAAMEAFLEEVADTYPIPDANDRLADCIQTYRERLSLATQADLEPLWNEICARHRRMFSEEALAVLQTTARQWQERLPLLSLSEPASRAMTDLFSRALHHMEGQKRPVLLRRFLHIHYCMEQYEALFVLADAMDGYTRIRQTVLRENELRVQKRFDRQLEAEIATHAEQLVKAVDAAVNRLYKAMNATDADLLHNVAGITSFDNQQARVLALLMADPKVKRTELPGLLGVYGNLNPVVSRLVSGRLKPAEEQLTAYAAKHPESMAHRMLLLLT